MRSLCCWRVDWRAAVQSLGRLTSSTLDSQGPGKPLGLVDFGPGGGCGAMQLTSHAAGELGTPEAELRLDYFTQLYRPGRLPQSWLDWTAAAPKT